MNGGTCDSVMGCVCTEGQWTGIDCSIGECVLSACVEWACVM